MLSRFMRLSVLSLIVLSLASPGFAARRSSLGGNLLIKDTDEIFFFPQRVVDYNRLVTFDFGTSSSFGSGGMLFGNESIVFGAFTHRSDFIGAIPNAFFMPGDIGNVGNGGQNDYPISSFPGLIESGPSGGPYQWFDVLFGSANRANPWGVRLSIGRNQEDIAGDNNNDQASSVNVIVGTTVRETDLSAEISFATSETETGLNSKTESSPIGFSVAARRTATEESEDLQLGWLGMFTYATGGLETTTGGTASTVDQSGLAFTAGLGPVYTPMDRTSVAMYGTFEYLRGKRDGGAGAAAFETTVTNFVIPGVNVAAEIEIASWLQWRGAVVSRFSIDNTKDTSGSPAVTTEEQFAGLSFDWHTGVGFSFDNFKIDGYIDPEVVTSGTDLLGNSSDLFGLVTASYSF